MKRIIIIRHSKTEQIYEGISDFDRKLMKRGIHDAKKISNLLKEKQCLPGLMITSPAQRAVQTARIFADSFDYPEDKIQIEDFIYGYYTTHEFIKMIHRIDDLVQTVIIVGHNPNFTAMVSRLAKITLSHLPTTGVAGIDFEVDRWKEIEVEKGKLVFFEYPKKYEDK
jgi:phosphohistidine phosphatase